MDRGHRVAVCVDSRKADWLDVRHVSTDADATPEDGPFVIGIGGTTPEALIRRLALHNDYLARGFEPMTVVHPAATVSPSAIVGPGTVVLAGAIVQPAAHIEAGAIVNTGAIVEHGCRVGDRKSVGSGQGV